MIDELAVAGEKSKLVDRAHRKQQPVERVLVSGHGLNSDGMPGSDREQNAAEPGDLYLQVRHRNRERKLPLSHLDRDFPETGDADGIGMTIKSLDQIGIEARFKVVEQGKQDMVSRRRTLNRDRALSENPPAMDRRNYPG